MEAALGSPLRWLRRRSIAALEAAFAEASEEARELAMRLTTCRVPVGTDLDAPTLEAFANLSAAHAALAATDRIWEVCRQGTAPAPAGRPRAAAVTAPAGGEAAGIEPGGVLRPVSFGTARSGPVASDPPGLRLADAAGTALDLFPGFCLLHDDGAPRLRGEGGPRITVFDLRELHAEATTIRLLEPGEIPPDAADAVVGHGWSRLREDGTPDLHHPDTRRLPILRYGTLHLRGPEGLDQTYVVSRAEAAIGFARALKRMQAALDAAEGRSAADQGTHCGAVPVARGSRSPASDAAAAPARGAGAEAPSPDRPAADAVRETGAGVAAPPSDARRAAPPPVADSTARDPIAATPAAATKARTARSQIDSRRAEPVEAAPPTAPLRSAVVLPPAPPPLVPPDSARLHRRRRRAVRARRRRYAVTALVVLLALGLPALALLDPRFGLRPPSAVTDAPRSAAGDGAAAGIAIPVVTTGESGGAPGHAEAPPGEGEPRGTSPAGQAPPPAMPSTGDRAPTPPAAEAAAPAAADNTAAARDAMAKPPEDTDRPAAASAESSLARTRSARQPAPTPPDPASQQREAATAAAPARTAAAASAAASAAAAPSPPAPRSEPPPAAAALA
ncbi:MAG: hypothetical protein IRZ13_19965, partial [Acetobacteraceae bacterium]|nr:hypothetical protein [Acetobacteraceae bacterium]